MKVLNDELFSELGATWYAIDPLQFDSLSRPRLRSVQSRIEKTVAGEFGDERLPLIKDPRLSRLLPLWKPALERLTARTVYPITLRNPLEVAQSLMTRNEFDADLSYLLWARYYLDAEFHTRGAARSWVSYQGLLDDPQRNLRAISSDLAIDLRLTSAAKRKVRDYLSGQLRHHRTAEEQALIELERLPVVRETYRVLAGWAAGRQPEESDFAALDEARRQFDELGGTLSRVIQNARLDRKRLASARTQAEDASAELARTRKRVEDLGAVRSLLENQAAAQARLEQRLDSALKSLAEAIGERTALEQRLAATVENADRERVMLEKTIGDIRAEAAKDRSALEQTLTDTRKEAAKERAALEQSLAQSLAEAAKQRSSLECMLAEANAQARNERSEAERRLAKTVSEGNRDRLALEKKIAEAVSASEALGNEIKRLQASAKRAAEEQERARAKAEDEFKIALGTLQADREALDAELKDVKRKYRSTQHQLARDREKLRRTSEQLSAVQEELAALRATWVWRGYEGVAGAVGRGTAIVSGARRKNRRRRADALALIRESSLFDSDWYLARYPDVASAGADPALHYLESGWREGRDPSASFSTNAYLRANADVAKAGLNPLLHFIEFGYGEGRSIAEVSRPDTTSEPLSSDHQFGPAAPCASFPVKQSRPIRWRRAARLEAGPDDAFAVGGTVIGLLADAEQRAPLERAFAQLAVLSGEASPEKTAGWNEANEGGESSRLLDGWFASKTRLRSRWTLEQGPTVVRAYQAGPGVPRLVGEALLQSETDFIDAELANPYFPLLFVLSSPDGEIHSTEFLAFPSLCRGGVHYPELVAMGPKQDGNSEPLQVGRISRVLEQRLKRIIGGSSPALIGKLLVDLRGADGSEVMFQPQFQQWLSRVVRVSVEPAPAERSATNETYLAAAIRVKSTARRKTGRMLMPADAVPSIGILAANSSGEKGLKDAEIPLPLIVGADDPSQPATLIHLPPVGSTVLDGAPRDYPSASPRVWAADESIATDSVPAAIIRYPKRVLPSDSELLVPVAAPALRLTETTRAITWLVFPEDWDEEVLAQGLETLALQSGPDPAVVLVGEAEANTISVGRQLFGSRASHAPDVTAALEAAATPLIGYLGAHILLHDARTSAALSALLEDPRVVSASCVVVATEKRGKGWHVSVADAGAFTRMSSADRHAADKLHDSMLLWRATYPALRPPRDLWLARSAAVRGWQQRAGPLRPEEGIQACTSLVTASYLGQQHDRPAHLRPPASAEQRSIRSEALFG